MQSARPTMDTDRAAKATPRQAQLPIAASESLPSILDTEEEKKSEVVEETLPTEEAQPVPTGDFFDNFDDAFGNEDYGSEAKVCLQDQLAKAKEAKVSLKEQLKAPVKEEVKEVVVEAKPAAKEEKVTAVVPDVVEDVDMDFVGGLDAAFDSDYGQET